MILDSYRDLGRTVQITSGQYRGATALLRRKTKSAAADRPNWDIWEVMIIDGTHPVNIGKNLRLYAWKLASLDKVTEPNRAFLAYKRKKS